MPSINLAPGTQQVVAAQRRRQRLFVLAGVLLLAVPFVWGGLFLYRQRLDQHMTALDDRLQTVEREISQNPESTQRIELFEQRLAALGGLLDQHISWEPVLQGIERLLPASVRLKTISAGSRTGKIVIEGTTADVDQISQALASLLSGAQSVFSSGELKNVHRKTATTTDGQTQVSYEFQLLLAFNPSVLTSKK